MSEKKTNSDSEEGSSKYRQLALFSVIIAEVVVTPSVLGGLVYWFLRGHEGQSLWTGVAAVAGLGIGFYRVGRLGKS